jgi:hypothetical protein
MATAWTNEKGVRETGEKEPEVENGERVSDWLGDEDK